MIYVIAIVVLLLIMWWTVRYYGQRPMTEAEFMVAMCGHIEEASRVMGEALVPALAGVAEAVKEFERTWKITWSKIEYDQWQASLRDADA